MRKYDIKNQLIIMCGISGSGKTHHALRFVEKGYIRLSTDELIWKSVGSGLYNLSKEEKKSLFTQSTKEVYKKLNELLKKGKKVILDGTHCKRSVRDDIRKICKSENVKPVFIFCKADKDELWHRLLKRKGTGPDDLIVTQEELSEYCIGFEGPQEDEKDVIIIKNDILK